MRLRFAILAAVVGVYAPFAQAAVYQCRGAAGEILFTDAACPPGYTIELVVEDPPAPERPAPTEQAVETPKKSVEPQKDPVAEAEAARLKAELENARLRAELDQERLSAIDRKLDALLDQRATYGGTVGVVPLGVIAKPFPVCKGKKGEVPWVNCRPRRGDLDPKVVHEDVPSCGIFGCTPSIIRRLDRGDAPRARR